MKAALLAVGLAVVSRHPNLTIALTAGLGAAVAGQVAYIIRKALAS